MNLKMAADLGDEDAARALATLNTLVNIDDQDELLTAFGNLFDYSDVGRVTQTGTKVQDMRNAIAKASQTFDSSGVAGVVNHLKGVADLPPDQLAGSLATAKGFGGVDGGITNYTKFADTYINLMNTYGDTRIVPAVQYSLSKMLPPDVYESAVNNSVGQLPPEQRKQIGLNITNQIELLNRFPAGAMDNAVIGELKRNYDTIFKKQDPGSNLNYLLWSLGDSATIPTIPSGFEKAFRRNPNGSYSLNIPPANVTKVHGTRNTYADDLVGLFDNFIRVKDVPPNADSFNSFIKELDLYQSMGGVPASPAKARGDVVDERYKQSGGSVGGISKAVLDAISGKTLANSKEVRAIQSAGQHMATEIGSTVGAIGEAAQQILEPVADLLGGAGQQVTGGIKNVTDTITGKKKLF
jgi:hypothetical protein